MEYSAKDKMNMSVERLRQDQIADFLNELSEQAEIIHRSLWSIIIRDGQQMYKMYYHEMLGRIKLEIIRSQLMGQIPIQLFDDRKWVYYLKADIPKFRNISSNDNDCKIAEQIDDWCEQWNRRNEFAIAARKTWKSEMVPYMVNMLTLYGEDTEEHIEYLNGLQEDVVIHGDFTVENVKKSGEELIILNMEMAFIGPKLWDKTTFVYSLIEHGCIELGMKLFERFQCNKRMLACIAAVRLAIARGYETNFMQRENVYDFIKNI